MCTECAQIEWTESLEDEEAGVIPLRSERVYNRSEYNSGIHPVGQTQIVRPMFSILHDLGWQNPYKSSQFEVDEEMWLRRGWIIAKKSEE